MQLTTPVLAASPLGLRLPRVVDRGLLLIGDAAGAPDPITGDGIAMAMASVQPAADAIVSGDLASYERVRLAMGRNADRLGRLLLAVSRAEGRAAHALLRKQSLVTTLLDVALGRREWMRGRWCARLVCAGNGDHGGNGSPRRNGETRTRGDDASPRLRVP